MGALAEAGVGLVGENRLQDLEAKHERWGRRLRRGTSSATVQSRKVKRIVPAVRLIHSIASDSALRKLEPHAGPETEVLVEVNLAGEESKAGIGPEELGEFIERSPVRVSGLMTMPPFTEDPEASRPYFARLAQLAGGARPDAALDGDQPGLAGGGRGGRDDRPPRDDALPLSAASPAMRFSPGARLRA